MSPQRRWPPQRLSPAPVCACCGSSHRGAMPSPCADRRRRSRCAGRRRRRRRGDRPRRWPPEVTTYGSAVRPHSALVEREGHPGAQARLPADERALDLRRGVLGQRPLARLGPLRRGLERLVVDRSLLAPVGGDRGGVGDPRLVRLALDVDRGGELDAVAGALVFGVREGGDMVGRRHRRGRKARRWSRSRRGEVGRPSASGSKST